MKGFLVIAQYAFDDIPLQLHGTRKEALAHISTLQKESLDSLHDLAEEPMEVLDKNANVLIRRDELALTEFDKNGVVCEHETFGLDAG